MREQRSVYVNNMKRLNGKMYDKLVESEKDNAAYFNFIEMIDFICTDNHINSSLIYLSIRICYHFLSFTFMMTH